MKIAMLNEYKNEYRKDNFFNKENYKKIHHKSGLTIILHHMPEYNYAYGVLGVKYGSVNNEFKLIGEREFTQLPQGTAHFLEHKMFENEDGEDVFQKLSLTGAISNAYTGFNQTCYMVSSSENFKKSLEILIDSVMHPYFTNENVQKERGIIAQEIKMYEDDPNWRCWFNLFNSLFINAPIKHDIAGTVESIEEITPEVLYNCYYSYYNFNNMVLSIAGNFNFEEIIEIVDKILLTESSSRKIDIVNRAIIEPITINSSRTVMNLPVKIPYLKIGFKHKASSLKSENFIQNLKLSLINEIIAGKISKLYEELYYSRSISSQIESEIFSGEGYLCSVFSCSSNRYVDIEMKIFEAIENMKNYGISESSLMYAKNNFYGNHIMSMDSPEAVAENHMDGFINDFDFVNWKDVIMSVTKRELESILENNYSKISSSISIIES